VLEMQPPDDPGAGAGVIFLGKAGGQPFDEKIMMLETLNKKPPFIPVQCQLETLEAG
jgi:hypothetical protein